MENADNKTEQLRKITGAVLGPVCAILLWMMPIAGISEQAHHFIAGANALRGAWDSSA